MLIGKKVRLRRIEKADLWTLWQWHEDRGLQLFTEFKQLISWDELNQNFMQYFGWKGYFIVECERGRALGVCSYKDINWKNRSCELALQFFELKQTYAIETVTILLRFLFEELNMSRVYSFAPAFYRFENKLFEKVGFVSEGKLREAVFHDGKYHDILTYAILKRGIRKESG